MQSKLYRLSELPTEISIPLFLSKVKAGFPSPCEDYLDGEIDLNTFLIQNPPATYFMWASGDSMIDVGIQEQSLLIIDRSITPQNNQIVVAQVNQEFTVKRLELKKNTIRLLAENSFKEYPPIVPKEGEEVIVWGVVTGWVHKESFTALYGKKLRTR